MSDTDSFRPKFFAQRYYKARPSEYVAKEIAQTFIARFTEYDPVEAYDKAEVDAWTSEHFKNAKVVYGAPARLNVEPHKIIWDGNPNDPHNTHQALIIGIRPIEKKESNNYTAEQVIEDLKIILENKDLKDLGLELLDKLHAKAKNYLKRLERGEK